jgi:hypothetical protein
MIHILAQATKNTKCAAYAEPVVNAALRTDDQYVELTQEQHTMEEWNRILLALSNGDFATASEYDEIEQRASKASGFSTAFTPREQVKFQDQNAATDVFLELDVTINTEVRANLQSDSSANTEERVDVTREAWSAMYQRIKKKNQEKLHCYDVTVTTSL